MIGVRMDYLKRILTIALCSILLICAYPTFSIYSEAAEVAFTTEFLRSAIGYLSGYLVSKGYSIAQNSSFDIDSALDASFPVQYQIYESFMSGLDAYSSAHRVLLQNALTRAFNSGVFSIDESTDEALSNYLESITVNDSLQFGLSSERFQTYNPGDSSYSFTYVDTQLADSPLYTLNVNISVPYEFFPVINQYFSSTGLFMQQDLVFFPAEPITSYDSMNTIKNSMEYTVSHNGSGFSQNSLLVNSVTIGSVVYYYIKMTSAFNYNSHFLLQDSLIPSYLYGNRLSDSDLANIYSYILSDGYYDASSVWESSQIVDTSDKDILSSASEVNSDTGDVSGGFTLYMKNWSLYLQILKQFSQGILSWNQAIKALGLSQVSVNATPAEKEAALDVVVNPTDDYLWFTETAWGAESIQATTSAASSTRAEEDALANSIANTANGGTDPEDKDNKSRGKGLLALLLVGLGIWNTPIIAGDGTSSGGGTVDSSGSGDTSGYLSESIAGMAVAGTLVNDLFDSAGGSSGYGLVYTVGASFVIFSVIIGAANYFGALFHGSDTKQNIKASGKKSTPGKQKKGG